MDNAFKYKKPKKKIEFILTGFGAFGSHLTNPTSILIENILENRKEFENNQLFEIGPCEVLFVAAEDCHGFYDKTLKYIETKRKENNEIMHIIIHFGLYSGTKTFNLEMFGHNCADFRIPDNRNNQFIEKQIISQYPLEHLFKTIIPVTSIYESLKSQGFKTSLSEDPGRYICNYIYYLSLYHGYKNEIPSLFVHFPDFKDINKETQVNFAKALFNSIAEEYNR